MKCFRGGSAVQLRCERVRIKVTSTNLLRQYLQVSRVVENQQLCLFHAVSHIKQLQTAYPVHAQTLPNQS